MLLLMSVAFLPIYGLSDKIPIAILELHCHHSGIAQQSEDPLFAQDHSRMVPIPTLHITYVARENGSYINAHVLQIAHLCGKPCYLG